MRGSGLISLCFVLLASCGNLSTNPGADAGVPRLPCADCPERTYTVCVAGECHVDCSGEPVNGCAGPEHCVLGACWPDDAPGCADLPCTAAQVCVSGSCAGRTEVPCTRVRDEACPIGTLCDVAGGHCVEPPACNADFTCRVGDRGATCNAEPGAGPEKYARIAGPFCLIGLCSEPSDCPAPRTCVFDADGGTTLGECR